MDSLLKVKISRNGKVVTYPFTDYFQGFEGVEAVRRLFGEETEAVLHNLKVEFYNGRGYMSVCDQDGHLRINANYLHSGDFVNIYLDILHELVHIKQFRDGKTLFSKDLIHINESIEIEACRYTVDEARRLGLDNEQLLEYLRTDRMSDEDFNKLLRALNMPIAKAPKT